MFSVAHIFAFLNLTRFKAFEAKIHFYNFVLSKRWIRELELIKKGLGFAAMHAYCIVISVADPVLF